MRRSLHARGHLLSRGIDAVLRELRRVHKRSGALLDIAEDFLAEARGDVIYIAAEGTCCMREGCHRPGHWPQCFDCSEEMLGRRAHP